MKKITICILALSLISSLQVRAAEEIPAKTLAELLQLVKDGKVVNSRQNDQREHYNPHTVQGGVQLPEPGQRDRRASGRNDGAHFGAGDNHLRPVVAHADSGVRIPGSSDDWPDAEPDGTSGDPRVRALDGRPRQARPRTAQAVRAVSRSGILLHRVSALLRNRRHNRIEDSAGRVVRVRGAGSGSRFLRRVHGVQLRDALGTDPRVDVRGVPGRLRAAGGVTIGNLERDPAQVECAHPPAKVFWGLYEPEHR